MGKKLDILAFGAHPDDVELGCSGTLLKYIQQGKKVGIIDLTAGELGTRGNAKIRQKEAEEVKRYLKLTFRDNLGIKDGFIDQSEEYLIKVITCIRTYKPELVLCNAPSDRHPDHGMAAQLVSRACFLSGLEKIETAQTAWRPRLVLNYIQDYHLEPSIVVDISAYMTQKLEVIKLFESQFFDPQSKAPETPISRQDFLSFVEARARTMGRMIGTEFGEGFVSARPLGVRSIFNLI